MEKKYSIVINNVNENIYNIVINSFDVDENGERVNIETQILNYLTFDEIKTKINNL